MSGTESQRPHSADLAPLEVSPIGPGAVDRRTFLVQATVLAASLIATSAIAAPIDAGAPTAAAKEVMEIASFLTDKSDLSDDLVNRAYTALLAEHPDFDQRLKHLNTSIHRAGLSDMETFKHSRLAAEPELMETVTALVGALYTGRVGTGYRGHFVAYKDALMYRPTADVTVIPTYAHWGQGYWTESPK